MMKAVMIMGCWLMCSLSLMAQKPENVHSIVKISHPNEWYIEQARLWKAEISKNPQNADAWFNYYRANRMMKIILEKDVLEDGQQRFKRLNGIVDSMEKAVPNSFEFHYVKWYNGFNDLSQLPHLQKAYEIAPERPETWADLGTYYETTGDYVRRDEFFKKLFEHNEPIQGLLHYNYNVLQSVAANGILLTAGDNDTYPVWILQAAKDIRKDVKLLNLNLLLRKEYRDRVFKELNIPQLALDPMEKMEDYSRYKLEIIQHITKNKTQRPVFVGCTVGPDYTKPVQEQLYLVGLTFRYSQEKIDHIAWLKKNVEQSFALDYLHMQFHHDPFMGVVHHANSNYMIPFLALYDHYQLAGEKEKALHYRELAMLIARNSGREEELKQYFSGKE